MLRFLAGLLLVMGLFCAVWSFLGEEAFTWALIAGIAVPTLWFTARPRRGVQHAYWNWLLLQLCLIILSVGAIFAAFVVVVVQLDISPDFFEPALMVLMIVVGGCVYWWGHWVGPPTRRRAWLRRKYPKGGPAIERYRKSGE